MNRNDGRPPGAGSSQGPNFNNLPIRRDQPQENLFVPTPMATSGQSCKQGGDMQEPDVPTGFTPINNGSYAAGDSPHSDAPSFVRYKTGNVKLYPIFPDGDVIIASPSGRTWKLHSDILAKSSHQCEQLLMETSPFNITPKMKQEGKIVRWKLEMVREPKATGCDPESLVFKRFQCVPVSTRSAGFIQNLNGTGQRPEFDEIFDNFFRVLYHMKPVFTTENDDHGMRSHIHKISQLLQAATYIDGVHAIRVTLESSLLRLSDILWQHIAAKPEGWVPIAARLQSDIMFRECMVHLVGRYHIKGGVDERFLTDPEHGAVGRKIWSLIVRKAGELKAQKLWIERHLIEWYPPRMAHCEDEVQMPGRSTYGNDIYLWIALNLVRQFISAAYVQNHHHRASDAGVAFFRTVGAEGPSYLRHTTLERFHVAFDMTSKAKKVLQDAVELIKKDISEIVKPLLIDNSQALKPGHANRGANGWKYPHLTCIEINDEEMPWLEDEDDADEGGVCEGVEYNSPNGSEMEM